MHRVTAKICGLSTAETLNAAIAGEASHVGFVFFPPSPRSVSFEKAAALTAQVPGHVRRVGVFVDPCNALIEQAGAAGGLDVIQLHRCTPGRAATIKAHCGLETWGAIAVKTSADLRGAEDYRGAVDRLLYDARTPDGATLPGGMGIRFDWRLLQGFAHPLPWALSGGLDVGNVAEAVRVTGASIVDISSGVESTPGVKDMDKIAAFLKAVAAL